MEDNMVMTENPVTPPKTTNETVNVPSAPKKKPSILLLLPVVLFFVAGVYLVVSGMSPKKVADSDEAMNGTFGEGQPAVIEDESVYVVNSGQVLSQGKEVPIEISIKTTQNVTAFEFSLIYDPAVLELGAAELGPFLSSTGSTANILGPVPDGPGSIKVGGFSFGDGTGVSGEGILLKIMATPLQSGDTAITLDNVSIVGAENEPYDFTSVGGQLVVN